MDFISIGFNLLFRVVYAKKDLALKVAYDFSFPGLVAFKPVSYNNKKGDSCLKHNLCEILKKNIMSS